ncbi:cysteine desulfurase family protein [Nitrospinaceae bacterium]|nr:cysteine desulfurase family protein [Nitrospinaceae bacterium]
MEKIYLDHNATTPLHPEVLNAMLPALQDNFGNPSSIHSFGRSARVQLDEAREKVARLIGASSSEIIFTSGGTEANNLALLGVALKDKEKKIITSKTEHPSVLNPCRQLEEQGVEVHYLDVDRFGRIDINNLESQITESTALISLQHANSETGVLQDIKKISELARSNGVLFHTDAVQSVAKIEFDLKDCPVDMLSISAHKFNGPKGVGALFLRKGTPALFAPVSGGSQEKKRRGGTENVAGIIGFGKACEIAIKRVSTLEVSRVAELKDYFYNKVYEMIPGTELFGDMQNSLPNTLNLGFAGVEGDTLLIAMDMEGVAVSTGSACSSGTGLPSPVLQAMGVPDNKINSSIRFSLGCSTTKTELDSVLKTLVKAVSLNNTAISWREN